MEADSFTAERLSSYLDYSKFCGPRYPKTRPKQLKWTISLTFLQGVITSTFISAGAAEQNITSMWYMHCGSGQSLITVINDCLAKVTYS
jgi:hypothetical protein